MLECGPLTLRRQLCPQGKHRCTIAGASPIANTGWRGIGWNLRRIFFGRSVLADFQLFGQVAPCFRHLQ
jgi:hypothetical protein